MSFRTFCFPSTSSLSVDATHCKLIKFHLFLSQCLLPFSLLSALPSSPMMETSVREEHRSINEQFALIFYFLPSVLFFSVLVFARLTSALFSCMGFKTAFNVHGFLHRNIVRGNLGTVRTVSFIGSFEIRTKIKHETDVALICSVCSL